MMGLSLGKLKYICCAFKFGDDFILISFLSNSSHKKFFFFFIFCPCIGLSLQS